jgi:predicted nucleotidyltransferase
MRSSLRGGKSCMVNAPHTDNQVGRHKLFEGEGMTVEELKKVVAPACKAFKVKRLDLFGSMVRGEDTAASDIDLVVEFEEPDVHPSKRFFGLLHHLEDTLDCEIDLLTIHGLRNPYFRRRVLTERMPIYGG